MASGVLFGDGFLEAKGGLTKKLAVPQEFLKEVI